jgi:hypothetical protein
MTRDPAAGSRGSEGRITGTYQIVRRSPTAEGEFQYVITSEYEDHQRVAKESELSRN